MIAHMVFLLRCKVPDPAAKESINSRTWMGHSRAVGTCMGQIGGRQDNNQWLEISLISSFALISFLVSYNMKKKRLFE